MPKYYCYIVIVVTVSVGIFLMWERNCLTLMSIWRLLAVLLFAENYNNNNITIKMDTHSNACS